MPFIAFLGCDGSGKSALIKRISEVLSAEGVQISLGHWRPEFWPSRRRLDANCVERPHEQVPRGWVSSIIKLLWLWFQWWGAWFRELRVQSRDGFVLFDRFHADLVTDGKRYRYGAAKWLAKFASRSMPQPDRVFFLDAPPEVLLSRKQETDRAELLHLRSAYHKLARGDARFRIIDASEPMDRVVEVILSDIRGMSEKSLCTNSKCAKRY